MSSGEMAADRMVGDCIVDASVGIKLFLDEDGSDAAHRLFAALEQNPPVHFYVPDLFFVECANILWKYVRFHGYPAQNAREDVVDLQALRLHTVSTADLLPSALELALVQGITAYDACYVALAQELALPLVTADGPLRDKLAANGVAQTMTLSEF